MIKQVLKLALMGFVLGMAIGNIIAIIASFLTQGEALVFAPQLQEKVGGAATALALQTLLSGVLGAAGLGGVALYKSENLGLLAATSIHFAICIAAYYPIAFFLEWIRPVFSDVITWFIIEAVAFFVIWLIMYIKCQIEVRQLNELLRKETA